MKKKAEETPVCMEESLIKEDERWGLEALDYEDALPVEEDEWGVDTLNFGSKRKERTTEKKEQIPGRVRARNKELQEMEYVNNIDRMLQSIPPMDDGHHPMLKPEEKE